MVVRIGLFIEIFSLSFLHNGVGMRGRSQRLYSLLELMMMSRFCLKEISMRMISAIKDLSFAFIILTSHIHILIGT